ncbi:MULTISPECIES: hypothetical protein [unclassified Streptomyces]|uniref:hypothetical protein n=1 Tax=unclassified Streptomyces TaxID=2593676 RepID=UPI0006F4FCA7|nr:MULTISPECIES: hypothetical protein [unclassified Streptomyces]KQX53476.1 hypothetical protein ASD33_09920 [Streptomyces sp. Root1304]KRA90394.1 hypothetical protein ASE09_09925 [Streptomyces sp. Root66D1]
MSVRRRLTTATGAVLLTLTVAGCSGLGRTAVGPLSYETQRELLVSVTSPLVQGCHRLAPSGATRVVNDTLVDVVMYRTRDCKGENSIYVPTNSSNRIAPGTLPWRSYSIIH